MASYPKPTNTGSTFNAPNWIAPTVNSADTAFLNANYCQYPTVQGGINTKSITATGSVGVSSNILMNGVAGVNYIEFPDGTKQYTGTQDFSGYAFTDISNTFTKLNTFDGNLAIGGTLGINYIQYPDGSKQYTAPAGDDINTVYNDVSNTFLSPTIQKFQGSNATEPLTAPLQFTNVSTGEFGSLYVDPSVNNDLTLYSNQSGGGLTIRNVDGNSFTINPTTGNTCSIINPVDCSFSITGDSLTTGTDLTFSSDGTVQTTAFTTSLLTPYALLASPALTGSATLDGNPIATTNQIPSIVGLAPLASPALTGSATLDGNPIATTNQIPSIVGLAPLASPALTGTATLNGNVIATVNQITSTGIIQGTTPVLTFPTNLYTSTLAQTGYFTNDIVCSTGSSNIAIYLPNTLVPIDTGNYNWFVSMNQDFQFTISAGDMQTLYGFWYYAKPVASTNLLQIVMCASLHFNNGTNCNGLPSASFTWMAIPKTLA